MAQAGTSAGADARDALPSLTVMLASPRGFCAGVDRAIQIVERAIEKYGAPVYVRHEIVHNRFVVETLEAKGAIFVEELDEVPNDAPVVFSAHGVPKSVPAEAERRKLLYLDATCPLVSKVHREAERHYRTGHTVILIGHAGHPEVIGTMGQLPPGAVRLVESVEDVATLEVDDAENLAFATQTTLSLDDTVAIVDALKAKFPTISAPNKQDICYATTNRQEAIKVIAPHCDAVLVIGAPNSSNSVRLVEVARRAGCDKSMLVQRAADLDWSWFDGIATLGITAGASAPEVLVEEVMAELHKRYAVSIQSEPTTVETITFKLPRELSPA
jgi:4-hydroxy-3-methylbut-2-enyl diphosphate reductase